MIAAREHTIVRHARVRAAGHSRILLLVCTLLAAAAAAACGGNDPAGPPDVATIAVTPGTATRVAGQSVRLSATTSDASGGVLTGRVITWSSASSAVATVDSTGLVQTLTPGTAVITATSGTHSATASITVVAVPVANITVAPAAVAKLVGQTHQLNATVRDSANAVLTGRTVTWSSSNNAVATVSLTGLVTAVGVGGATITAASGTKSGSATISVSLPTAEPVATITLSPASGNLGVGDTATIGIVVRGASGAVLVGRTVTWSSSAANIASVNGNGQIVGVAVGTAIITASSEGRTGTSTVNVVVDPCSLGAAATINIGQTVSGTITPADCNLGIAGDIFYGDVYKLVVATGTTLRIDMASTVFDTWLSIADVTGTIFVEDDDSGGGPDGTNSRVQRFFAAGTYYLVPNTAIPQATGPYTMSVTAVAGVSAGAQSAAQSAGPARSSAPAAKRALVQPRGTVRR